MIQAYCEGYGFEGYIFRFVSILGERYTHGHVFDFYRQLLEHPDHLRVLGDGTQRKSYLYVQDCLDAMLHVTRAGTARARPSTACRSTISARRNIAGSRIPSAGFASTRLEAGTAFHRRRTRLGGRQPVHLPRHQQGPRDGLGVEDLTIQQGIIAHAARGCEENQWVLEKRSAGRPLSSSDPPSYERRRPRSLASGLRDGSVLRGIFPVVGLDFDEADSSRLAALARPRSSSRAWTTCSARASNQGRLRFTVGADASALAAADVLWVCYDTPVDDNDVADVPYVLDRLARCLPALRPGAVVLISSQIPAGTCRATGSAASRRRLRRTARKTCVWARRSTFSATRSASSSARARRKPARRWRRCSRRSARKSSGCAPNPPR